MPYTFDSTGTALQNMVIGEEITIPAKTTTGFLFALPAQGPYFWDSLVVKHIPVVGDEITLLPGVDFNPGYQYFEATARCNRMIVGAIQLVDVTRAGKLLVKYNCVGAGYTPTAGQLANLRANEKRDPQFTTWEMVCSAAGIVLPAFPTMEQVWGGLDSANLAKTISELERLGLVVQIRPELLTEPTSSVYIPSKAEVGLRFVENLPLASSDQAKSGTSNDAYMTPLRTAEAIAALTKQVLLDNGLTPATPYKAGLVVTDPKQTISYQDGIYAPRPSALPITTTGDFALDKEKFILTSSSDRDHWHSFDYTVTGTEAVDPDTGYKLIPTGAIFDGDVETKLIVSPISELVRHIDYHIHGGLLKVIYPIYAGDEVTFLWKRKSSIMGNDRPYHTTIKIKDGVRVFTLPNFDFMVAADVRLTYNYFAILRTTLDYTLVGNQLTLLFPSKIGDVIEITNQDSLPELGVLQTRSLLHSIQ